MTTKLPPGFTMRPAEMTDVPEVVAVSNIFSKHYLDVEEFSVNDIETEWSEPKFSPQDDVRLVFSPKGKLVAYIEIWTTSNPPVHPWIWARVHPDHEGLGVASHLMAWGEDRARDAIERCPEDARVALRAGIDSTIEPAKALLSGCDYQSLRYSFRMLIEMDSPPPVPVWADGITLKPYHPEKDAEAVYRADDEIFQDHFGYIQEPFAEGFKRFMHHMTKSDAYDPKLWFIAMDGDEIAGISLCRKWSYEDKETGYVSVLGVRRPWRKKGLGLALLQHSFGEFYQRGNRKVSLGVDGKNLTGALKLYKKAGMHVHRRFDSYEKEIRPGRELGVQSLEA
ncbi:MAG: GNAT family N-acetyltransferase [Chloroflexota bacterium]